MEEPLEERDYSDLEDGSEEEEVVETPEELGTALLKASAKGDIETVEVYLQKQADVNFKDNRNWTPLMWAAAQGHEPVVSLLLENGAQNEYKQGEDFSAGGKGGEVGKYNPLHWAAFNGHQRVVWTLMRKGFSPLDVDMYKNNAIHQASAGGRIEVIECFLSFGVDMDAKNARGHKAIDLATEPKVQTIIKAAAKVSRCTTCLKEFDFVRIRYFCQVCKRFFCREDSESSWIYETKESSE